MRHLLLAILCTLAFLTGGVGAAESPNGTATPDVVPVVQNQPQVWPLPVQSLKAGMLPLEVVAVLGMNAMVEYTAPLLTLTYTHDGEWVAVVFLDSKLISVQKGSTKATGAPP